jgi:hypothetical protein
MASVWQTRIAAESSEIRALCILDEHTIAESLIDPRNESGFWRCSIRYAQLCLLEERLER